MNSYERVMSVVSGLKPDVTPVIPWVREWCSIQAGIDFIEEIESAEKHVDAQSFCVSRFGYDCVWDLLGMSAESEAMGSELKIVKGHVPSISKNIIHDYSTDLSKLKFFDPYTNRRLATILEGTRRLRQIYAGKVPIVAYVQAPLRHVSMLRGTEKVMTDVFKQKDNLRKLCEIATDSLIVYAEAQIKAGADIICLGDPVSSGAIISKKTWQEWGFPYTKRLVDTIKSKGVKAMLHVCGNTTDRLESLAATGADILSLDMAVDFGKAREILGPDVCLMGNVSTTTLATGTPDEVRAETKAVIMRAGRNGRLIISAGCLIGETCPAGNMEAMVSSAHEIRIA
ncbi:MAG: uroporphyrinogen decarboxylase family protein [Nitrospirota bacterium]